MAKNNIALLVYQIGPNGAGGPLTPPALQGFTVKNIIEGPISTWKGDMSNPLASNDSGVEETLRYKVYSYMGMSTPSQSGTQRYYTNKTVAEIITDINS